MTGHDSKCDFCNSPDIKWLFPCRNFEWQYEAETYGFTFADEVVGWWAACVACGIIISQDDRNGLVERSYQVADEKETIETALTEVVRDFITQLQRTFWDNRIGEAVDVDNPQLQVPAVQALAEGE